MPQGGVEAVDRALKILAAFATEREELALHQLARITGLHKTTILRIAASLERHGYLRRTGSGIFRLGSMPWRLGGVYRRNFNVGDAVRPVLDGLVEATEESASYYVREGDVRVCLYRRNSPRPARHHIDEGEHLPLDRGSGGHILLAFAGAAGALYDQIRSTGYHVSSGERDPDVAGISVAIFNGEGKCCGVLVLSGLKSRFTREAVDRFLPLALTAAQRLTADLGGLWPERLQPAMAVASE